MGANILRIDLGGVNCYLVKGEQGFILFDTGGHIVTDKQFSDRRELLEKELNAAGCTTNDLKLIVLTHGDNDHAHNASYLRKMYNAKIAMHEGDRELVESPTIQKWLKSFNYRSLIYKLVFIILRKTITTVTQKTLDDFEPFTPDIFLKDGDSLSPYGLDANVFHVPGHTDGSIAIFTSSGELIVGDTLTNTDKPGKAPNAFNFKQLNDSLLKLKNLPIKAVYPGHGASF